MQHDPPPFPQDVALFLVVAEASARRRLSARYKLPSGAVPVLAAVAAVAWRDDAAIRPGYLHTACLVSPSLLRTYVRALCELGLLERFTRRAVRYVRLTATGATCVNTYQRYLRAGYQEYYTDTCISAKGA